MTEYILIPRSAFIWSDGCVENAELLNFIIYLNFVSQHDLHSEQQLLQNSAPVQHTVETATSRHIGSVFRTFWS